MRILIYSLNFSPELTGIGKYTGEMTEWLSAQGHEICVITAPPYYPAWQVWQNYSTYKYKVELNTDTVVYRCPLWVPKQVKGYKRILHLLSFAVSSLPVVLWQSLWWRPEIVWLVAPNICCAPGAWLAARLGGAKTWLHIQDFEVDAAFDLGILSGSKIRNLALAIESWLMQRFDRVSTIARTMLERLHHKGIDLERRVFFPNWVDTELIYPLSELNPWRKILGITPEQVVVLYAGNMGRKQGLEVAIRAAKILSDRPEIVFILCGDGTACQTLQEKARGLNNVRFLPLQPLDQLNYLLNLGDIHLLPQRADVADLVMPSKLSGILASGGVVIATAHLGTEVANVVNEAGGITIAPSQASELAAQIWTLAQKPDQRIQMKQQARNYALSHFSKEVILKEFQQEMARLGDRRPADVQSVGLGI